MSHTYVVASMTQLGSTVYVNGTVDNIPVQVSYPSSQTFASVMTFQAFIQPLMLAAAPFPVVGYTGTFVV